MKNSDVFKAYVVSETTENKYTGKITQKSIEDLPGGDVLVKVSFSSLNYKDALSATGNRGVTKKYPHTPGIDAAGIIEKSDVHKFNPGDKVIVTSYDLGMNTSGGFGQYIRVPADWIVKLPDNLTLKESMILGTAGFTAGLSVQKLITSGIDPDRGNILVTGASGGVGSMAVSLLSKIGFNVTAVSGKKEAAQFLLDIGAKNIISREEFSDPDNKPLLKERWAGAVDTVGGDILSNALKSTYLHGAVTCCGNISSTALHTTIFPFILRGISLHGINSQTCPMELRIKVWENLASKWKTDTLDLISNEIKMEKLNENIQLILKGKLKGRTIVNMA